MQIPPIGINLWLLFFSTSFSPLCYGAIQNHWIELDNITFSFDCTNRAIGFYADVEYNCQIFHMCDEASRRIPHLCANDTSFNQEYRICDWEYNFDCAEAPKWYYLNELTYATEPPKEEYLK